MNVKKNKELAYIEELEDKVVALSLQLKSKTNALNSLNNSHKKSIGKLIHNIKNPVGVIFSFSDMILEDLEDYTPQKLEKHLQIIKDSAAFSLKMISTVAYYTQLNSPDFTYNFKKNNYVNIVQEVVDELAEIADKKKCSIKFSTAIFTELMLAADEISIALKHIISNAIRYSPPHSTINITIQENDTTIDTLVIDEGIGISAEHLPKVFSEYFVVNTFSEDKQKCIGLGLSIANKIIKDHKGTINVTSNLKKGSTFKITLPK